MKPWLEDIAALVFTVAFCAGAYLLACAAIALVSGPIR